MSVFLLKRKRCLFMALILLLVLISGSVKLSLASTDEPEALQCVILLHGLGRTSGSMGKIAEQLAQNNYIVINQSYPSTADEVDVLANDIISKGLSTCRDSSAGVSIKRVHFVTHSMGGILVRAYLQQHQIPDLGRIVMISPPNQGSEIIDMLGEYDLFKWLMGPAAVQLGTEGETINQNLQPILGEIGIIAGNSTSDPWFSPFIPGDDDGKVSVESTKLAEMTDFIVLDNGHTFIMRSDQVIEQVLAFLSSGRFHHPVR